MGTVIPSAERSSSTRTLVARFFLIIGVLVQSIAFTTLHVFRPSFRICKGPVGVNPLPCDVFFRLSPKTAWQMLQFDKLSFVAGFFVLMAALSLAAGFLRSRPLHLVALAVTLLWVGLAAVLISLNVPDPIIRNGAWYAFLGMVFLSSLLLLAGNVISSPQMILTILGAT